MHNKPALAASPRSESRFGYAHLTAGQPDVPGGGTDRWDLMQANQSINPQEHFGGTGVETPIGKKADYICARCGVQSPEPTCFVIPDPHSKPPRDTRCLTCEAESRNAAMPRRIVPALLGILFFPFVFAHSSAATYPTLRDGTVAILLLPLVIVVHELGHAIVARVMNLEIGTFVVGVGRELFTADVFGVPVRLRLWPLAGSVVLGIPGGPCPRLRLWSATLAGPAANGLAVFLTVHYWNSIAPAVGWVAPTMWVILNAEIGLANLVPQLLESNGVPRRTDGLALLQIPRETPDAIRLYRVSAPVARAQLRFEQRNYVAALEYAQRAFAKDPSSDLARTTMSACLCRLGEFQSAGELLAPILERSSAPIYTAVARNDSAVAAFMANDHSARAAADRWSMEAFSTYPCLLAFRSTRAIVLTWIGRPDDALQLLEYKHYECASPSDRGEQAAARALALQSLGRTDEAEKQMAEARKLGTEQLQLIERLVPA